MADSSQRSFEQPGSEGGTGRAIEFENVTKRYGDVLAVDDVTFSVNEQEFLTLLGPSGAGKTTMLHMIAGFIRPTSGEIFIDGEPVSDKPPYERNIGMVFQSMALFPHKTVYGNIAFPLEMRRFDPDKIDDRVAEMLELVRLPGMENRRVSELSGGQQQRIAIARGLAFEPSLLLLDEPLSSLDKKLREEMRHEISRIHAETDVTTISVTHNQEEALTMADRIAVINDGGIEQLGETHALYEDPKTAFVANFIGNTNMFNGEIIDSDCRIRAGNGSIELTAGSDGFAEGDPVQIALRHELIRIGDRSLDADNVYEATVTKTVFRGDLIDYSVQIDGLETELSISELNRRSATLFGVGDTVTVGWNSDDVLVYPG